jgi:hypothetical protein
VSDSADPKVYIEWTSDFSSDVTLDVTMDSKFKKHEAFAELEAVFKSS